MIHGLKVTDVYDSKHSALKIALDQKPSHFGFLEHSIVTPQPDVGKYSLLLIEHDLGYVPATYGSYEKLESTTEGGDPEVSGGLLPDFSATGNLWHWISLVDERFFELAFFVNVDLSEWTSDGEPIDLTDTYMNIKYGIFSQAAE